MSDDIEKARAAHAALVAAKAACDAAGLTITCGSLKWEHGDVLAQCVALAKTNIASTARRAVPIALGDEVTVHGVNDARSGGPRRTRIASVGRTLIRLGDRCEEYRIEDGRWNGGDYGWLYHIDPDDLFRIKRDLVKRPKVKP